MAISQRQSASWEETQYLIDNLAAWGITYLSGGTGEPIQPLPPSDLVRRLAACEDSRVHYATISLFLLHPSFADAINDTMRESSAAIAEEIAIVTLATIYAQRCWRIRLTLAMGHAPCFPEAPFRHLWMERHLPSPAVADGRQGLHTLEAYQQQRSGLPIQYCGDWENQIDHLCYQEAAKPHAEDMAIIVLDEQEDENEQEIVTVIHRLAQKYTVEFAAPGDFIPLPQHEQPRYVGRYGEVNVFYYDFISLALSKIARGQDHDFRDVKLLLQQGIISMVQLEAEIFPWIGQIPLFAQRFAGLKQIVQNP